MANDRSSVETSAKLALLSSNNNILCLANAAFERASAAEGQTDRAELFGELLDIFLQSENFMANNAADFVRDQVEQEVRWFTVPYARALGSLAPHLRAEQRPAAFAEAVAAAKVLDSEFRCAEVLTSLAPHLPVELLAEALTIAMAANTFVGSQALASLAPHLPAELLAKALAAAKTITSKSCRAKALASLVPHLPAELLAETLAEALAVARAIADEEDRAKTLASLVPHLPAELVAETLAEAFSAARAADELEPQYGPDPVSLVALAEMRASAKLFSDEDDRSEALVTPHLPARLLAETLATAKAMNLSRAKSLVALVPHLPAGLLAEGFGAAVALANPHSRAYALAAFAPHLPAELLAKALAAAKAINNGDARALALGSPAPHLPESLHREFSVTLLQTLPVLKRHMVLRALKNALVSIEKLGGTRAISGVYQAISDVSRWYP